VQQCDLPTARKQQRILKPVNSVSRLLASGPKCHREKVSVKLSRSFDVGKENCVPVKMSEEVSVNRKNTSALTENRGLVRLFEEVADDNPGANMATCGPMKIFDNQSCIDSRTVSLKQTAADHTLSAVQQTTGCSETDAASADGGLVQENNSEVQTAVLQLSGELTAKELQSVYSRVFHRR